MSAQVIPHETEVLAPDHLRRMICRYIGLCFEFHLDVEFVIALSPTHGAVLEISRYLSLFGRGVWWRCASTSALKRLHLKR